MSSIEKRQRWEIMDNLFRSLSPVSADEVYLAWDKAGVLSRANTEGGTLQERYGLTFRQDMLKFKQAYADAGGEGDLFVKSEGLHDRRQRRYRYSNLNFSMLPILRSINTKSDWVAYDKAISKLTAELPENLAKTMCFLANSRVDALRGRESCVEWPDNPGFRGYDMLPEIYDYIRHRVPILVEFGLFGEDAKSFVLHPYYLKEYDGRWYCLGYREDVKGIWPICLDRVTPGSVRPCGTRFVSYESIRKGQKVDDYFSNVIGVTKEFTPNTARDYYVTDGECELLLGIHSYKSWMLLITNPIHRSQKVVLEYDKASDYGRFSMKLIFNIEMYNKILSFGPGVEVESPAFARDIVIDRLKLALEQYGRRETDDSLR